METRVKWSALFNKGAHPRPSLFEESSVHLNISNTIGKTKESKTTKEVKGTTIKTHREYHTNQTQQNFQTHVGQSGHGSKSFVCFCCVGICRCCLIVVPLTSLCLFCIVGFPDGVWFVQTCALKCLSVCLETIKQTCLWYKGFTFIRDFPW